MLTAKSYNDAAKHLGPLGKCVDTMRHFWALCVIFVGIQYSCEVVAFNSVTKVLHEIRGISEKLLLLRFNISFVFFGSSAT